MKTIKVILKNNNSFPELKMWLSYEVPLDKLPHLILALEKYRKTERKKNVSDKPF